VCNGEDLALLFNLMLNQDSGGRTCQFGVQVCDGTLPVNQAESGHDCLSG